MGNGVVVAFASVKRSSESERSNDWTIVAGGFCTIGGLSWGVEDSMMPPDHRSDHRSGNEQKPWTRRVGKGKWTEKAGRILDLGDLPSWGKGSVDLIPTRAFFLRDLTCGFTGIFVSQNSS